MDSMGGVGGWSGALGVGREDRCSTKASTAHTGVTGPVAYSLSQAHDEFESGDRGISGEWVCPAYEMILEMSKMDLT